MKRNARTTSTSGVQRILFAVQNISPQAACTYKLIAPGIFFLCRAFCGVRAQVATHFTVHANITYHFTKYIDWPPAKKTDDFISGVKGELLCGGTHRGLHELLIANSKSDPDQ